MAQVGVFCHVLFLSLMHYCVESCLQKHIQAQVPARLKPGYVVSQVNLEGCGDGPLDVTVSDPAFRVEVDGTIQTVIVTIVPKDGLVFWVTVQDSKDHTWFVDVSLTSTGQVSKDAVLKRSKRRWSPPPFSVRENGQPPFPKEMEMIASDTSVNYSLYYVIRGPGVTLPPVGMFSVVPNTGLLKVHGPIDREQYPKIVFTAYAYNTITDVQTDDPLPVTVMIEDENDNAPEFTQPMVYAVDEQCPMSTVIGTVYTTDRDEENTLHTKVKYSLKSGSELFRIDPFSGVITAATNTLNRETQYRHLVLIEARDMGGQSNGLSTTSTATVFLNDINDHPPVFTKSNYTGSIKENQANVLVAEIDVDDKDLKNTPNWRAVYEITKGNESGNFMIKTDPVSNKGLIYLIKPLDYEKQPTVNLEVTARNEVPLVGSNLNWQKVPVEIKVENVDEGPEFSVPILQLKVKENVPNGTVIGTYTATDPETKSSSGITYYKLKDPGSWINVVTNTGELKTAMTIDRESPLVSNNMYNITVKAIDKSQKTGTGTVIILIEDVNDNAPTINKLDPSVCNRGATQDPVLINATDLDQNPYSYPFTFELVKPNDGQWRLRDQKATSVLLEPTENLPNNIYKIPILVKDLQGFGKEQTLTVRVCDCTSNGECAHQELSTALGVWGILAMLLGLLLLLLLCVLCAFVCSTKGEKLRLADDDLPGGMLLKSNYEAPGEEVKSTMFLMSKSGVDDIDASKEGGYMDHSFGKKDIIEGAKYVPYMKGFMVDTSSSGKFNTMSSGKFNTMLSGKFNTLSSGQFNTNMYGGSVKKVSSMSTMDGWQDSSMLLNNKLLYFQEEEDGRFADDILRPYGFEGMGSPAGSVGCCSFLSEEESLNFLNELNPKFKTLAEVCTNKSQLGGK